MPKQLAMSILLVASALPASGQAPMHAGPQVPAPARIEVPGDGVILLMQDMEGRPVIDLKINGKGPYRFVLDTGATTTVVSDELSRELSLTPPDGVQVASVGGGPAPAIVAIHDLRIGNAVLEGMIAAVMPLGSLLKGENAPRGVLSAANFPGYLLTYDYPGKHISIKKGAIENADSKSTFQYSEEQVLPTVPIRIAGHDTEVHLDTGSAFGLTLPMKFLTEVPLASQPKTSGRVRTGGGEFPVSVARLNGTIELGKYKLDLDEVRFSDARPGPGPATGNIGYEILRHFVVTLDSKNRRIQLDQ
jgi:predicted aspartyl protease